MEVKDNGNGTYTISDMPEEVFDAINILLDASQGLFVQYGNMYITRGEIKCGITKKAKEVLDKMYWVF